MSASLPSAWAPTPSLVRSLRRSGWGVLGDREWRGVRDVLATLAEVLPSRSGEGYTTVAQVADVCRLSERWTRRCMAILEDAGLIRWHRGGVVDGRPVPSLVRITKRAIVELIAQARTMHDDVLAARRAQMRTRLSEAKALRGPAGVLRGQDRRRRRSDHAALSADPRFPRERDRTSGAPLDQEGHDMRPLIPITCAHDGDAGLVRLKDGRLVPACPSCRREQERARTDRLVGPVLDYAALAAGDTTLWDD